jgi:hypothetical protein
MPQTEPKTSYDPYQLISDVTELLAERGIAAATRPGELGEALGGAGMLLRALGVAPMIDSATALERSIDKVWSDQQDV